MSGLPVPVLLILLCCGVTACSQAPQPSTKTMIFVPGGTAVQMGVLAALPISANLAQMLGPLWLQKFGQGRKFSLFTVTVGRLLLVLILFLPLLTGILTPRQIVLALIVLTALS